MPLSKLAAGDLRVLIGQGIGLPFTVPLALEVLGKDLLVETEHYKGDLLCAVLRADPHFYMECREIRSKVESLLVLLPSALECLGVIDFDTTSEALEEAVSMFRRRR